MMTIMTMTMMMTMTGRSGERGCQQWYGNYHSRPNIRECLPRALQSFTLTIHKYKYTNTIQIHNKTKTNTNITHGVGASVIATLIFIITTSKLAKMYLKFLIWLFWWQFINPLIFSCVILVFLSDVLSVNLSNCRYILSFLLQNAHGCGLTAQNILS